MCVRARAGVEVAVVEVAVVECTVWRVITTKLFGFVIFNLSFLCFKDNYRCVQNKIVYITFYELNYSRTVFVLAF